MPIETLSASPDAGQRVLLVGAGGHGKVVADALQTRAEPTLLYFVDERESVWGQAVLGIPVLGALHTVLSASDGVHVAIGNNRVRERVHGGLDSSQLVTVQHPSAVISIHAAIGRGSFVAAAAVLGPGAQVGDGVIINHGAVVDHDCMVGNFCHVAPLASLAGNVCLGDGVLVGAGARVLPGVKVGAGAVIGAGSVVLTNVEPGATVVGVPACRRNTPLEG